MKTSAEYMREWRAKNPDRAKAINTRWRQANLPKRRAAFNKWRAENAEKQRERCRAWYEQNKARVAARNKAHYDADPDLFRGKARKWYHGKAKLDPALIQKNRKRANDYRKAHPEWGLEKQYIRRARSACTKIELRGIRAWLKNLRQRCFAPCTHCGVFIDPRRGHIDHIIPLSRGGAHTLSNLCLSCVECNLTKGAKLLSEWKPQYS